MDSLSDPHTRPPNALKPFEAWPNAKNTLDFVAGVVDTDGCILTNTDKNNINTSLFVKVDQAEKGVNLVHYMYNTFGGSINKIQKQTTKIQASYSWYLTGEFAAKFCKLIAPHMLIKKDQAEIASTFPHLNMHIIPIIATNETTSKTQTFQTKKDCMKHVGFTFYFDDEYKPIKKNKWVIERSMNLAEIGNIREQREYIRNKLKELKNTPHADSISFAKPSMAYIAGIMDGDGMFDTHGKNGQNHSLTQKYRPICDMLYKLYGGSVSFRKSNNSYTWEVYTFAPQLLKDIAPYIIGKKKQVDLIMNMKPGEASDVHSKLHDLKGKSQTRSDESMNKIMKPEEQNAKFKTPPKQLPKGVYAYENKFRVAIRVDKVMYWIGVFEDQTEAENAHLAMKRRVFEEKQGGPKVDLAKYRLENKPTNPLVSDDVRKSLPSGVHVTKANTFQVRGRKDNKVIQLGTHKTVEAAVQALNTFNEQQNNE
jgi:hypothetical protein